MTLHMRLEVNTCVVYVSYIVFVKGMREITNAFVRTRMYNAR